MTTDCNPPPKTEALSLPEAVTQLLDECRMVLPGIQALFGFQLIAVFNSTFDKLAFDQKIVHLVAIGLVACAVALVMTPAAYHRQTGPEEVSEKMIAIASRLLLLSMVPLATAICLDFYLIAWLILHARLASAILALGLFTIFISLWFVLPRAIGSRKSR